MPRRRIELATSFGLCAAVGAALALVVAASFAAPLGYDESYNLQVSLNLIEGHGYSTNGALFDGAPKQFDPFITTGPVLLLPVALAIALLGEHVWVFRLVPILAYVGLLVLWSLLGHRAAGRQGALFAAGGVLAISLARATWDTSPLAGPGDVLGEITSAALFIGSAATLRRPRVSGSLFGLAVMTKLVVLATLPALLLGVVVAAQRGSVPRVISMVRLLGFALLPVLAWQAVRVVVLGWAEALEANRQFLRVFVIGGSGIGEESDAGALIRLLQQSDFLGMPGLAAVVLSGTAIVVLHRQHAKSTTLTRVNPSEVPLFVIVFAGLALELWWLFIADRDFVRHSTQAAFFVVPAILVAVARVLKRTPRTHSAVMASCLISLLLGASVLSHGFSAFSAPQEHLAQQQMAAAAIAETDASAIGFMGWWQNPELTLLTGLPAKGLSADSTGLLVVAQYVQRADRLTMLERCRDTPFEVGGYSMCWVGPREWLQPSLIGHPPGPRSQRRRARQPRQPPTARTTDT